VPLLQAISKEIMINSLDVMFKVVFVKLLVHFLPDGWQYNCGGDTQGSVASFHYAHNKRANVQFRSTLDMITILEGKPVV